MVSAGLIVAGVMLVAGIVTELISVIAAPFGYQDKAGFHPGQKPEPKEESHAPANPS